MFPIHPNQRNQLSAAYGELRSTHFHAALDIRTQRRTGLAVHATAAGYVSRIKIQILGYGRALYVQHPNGYTSVYAHLQSFSEELERWTIAQQYARRAFAVDLRPRPWQFPVQAGEIIARSGNTGSSKGPHLHFEIRDKDQRAIDPLRVAKFREIVDTSPPQLRRLALRTMHIDARIGGQFGRFVFPLQVDRGRYYLQAPLQLQGCIGVELMARDLYDRGVSGYGLPELRMSLDGEEHFAQYIHTLDFHEQHHIVVHMNYAESVLREDRYSKLYVDDGNELPFYSVDERRGLLCFAPDVGPQRLELQLWDASGNRSELEVVVNQGASAALEAGFDLRQSQGYLVQDNTLLLHLRAARPDEQLRLTFLGAKTALLSPAYVQDSHSVYLWDLRKGVPMDVEWPLLRAKDRHLQPMALDFLTAVPSGQPYRFENADIRVDFSPLSLYDTLYLRFEKVARRGHMSETFTLRTRTIRCDRMCALL